MYDVVLLFERQLHALDAEQIISLHEGLEGEEVTYHLLLPVERAADTYAASVRAVGGPPETPVDPATADVVHQHVVGGGQQELDVSAELFEARGQRVTRTLTEVDPIDALERLVGETSAGEVIVLTEPHWIKEVFGADWTSRAERRLEVPTLHLLEHVPLEAQP